MFNENLIINDDNTATLKSDMPQSSVTVPLHYASGETGGLPVTSDA